MQQNPNPMEALFNEQLSGILDADDATLEVMLSSGQIDAIIDGLYTQRAIREQINQFRTDGMSKEDVREQLEDYQQSIGDLLAMLSEAEGQDSARVRVIDKLLSPGADFLREVYERFAEGDVIIQIATCHPNAQDPVYAHDDDGGADVWATEDVTIEPGATEKIPTGLQAIIPPGWMLSVRPRGGNSLKTKMRIANAPGTIDANYTDEIFILCDNIGKEPLTIKKGTRPAQLVVEKAYRAKFVRIEKIDTEKINRANENGEQSLSSTGE